MGQTYIDGIYSGKYYIYKSNSANQTILFRKWFRQRYIFNWLYMSFAVLIISLLLSGPASRFFTYGPTVLRALFLLIPSTATILILGLSVITFIKLSLIKQDSFIQEKIIHMPWIIGEILNGQGYLMVNLDLELEEESEHLLKIATTLIEELHDIDGFTATAALLLNINPKKGLGEIIKQKDQIPRLLAVLEIMKEQNAAENHGFFSRSDPLNYFIKISHS